MKLVLGTIFAAILFGIALNAGATEKPPVQTTPDQTIITVPVEQDQNQGQGQLQGQQTGVTASPAANANSTGTGTANVDLGSYAPNATNIDQRMRSLSLGFGAPVWTMVPQTADLCGKTKSSARKLVFGVAEWADSVQFTEAECAMLSAADKAETQCRHLTAAMIRQRVFTRMWKDVDWAFLSDGVTNLTPVACADLLRPRLIMDTRVSAPAPAAPVNIDVNASCSAPTPGTVTKPRTTKPKAKPVERCPKADRAVKTLL